LKEKNYCLVWSHQDSLIPRPVVTTDFVCLRLIADRSIDEGDFGKIKKIEQKKCNCGIIYSKISKIMKKM
jgi:hypothetical protein